MNCHRCGKPIPEGTGYEEVVGWQRKARGSSRRGGSDVVLREGTGKWRCAGCIHVMKLGHAPEQTSLDAA